MDGEQATQSNTGAVILGVVIAAAIGVIALVFLPEPAPLDAPDTASATEPAAPSPPVTAQDTIDPVADPLQLLRPGFDTFRVEPDGTMVVAGNAQPGETIDIVLSGETLDRVTADSVGNFVAFPIAGPSEVPRRLSLVADPDGRAISSETSYVVASILPPAAAAPQDPAILPDTTESSPLPAVPEDEPVLAEADSAQALPDASGSASLTVLETGADGIRVVQSGLPDVDDSGTENVALDAITYDPQGEVQLSGRATADGAVQVYLDNQPVSSSTVRAGGNWQIDLEDIETGLYTLRIDEVDIDGDVVSRLETPFRREEAEDVAAVLAEETSQDGFEVAVRTVQPGATLWAIAEESLGDGIFYVSVFEANRDLIKDPDLIYPGQVFRMPLTEE